MEKEKISLRKTASDLWNYIKPYVISVALGIATVTGYANFYLSDFIDERIVAYESKKDEHHKSFRQILSETMEVPTDMVPYVITSKFEALDSLMSDVQTFSDEMLPFVEHQMTWILPHMEIDPETGDSFWLHFDDRLHEVDYEFGFARIWYDHGWVPVYQ